MSTPRHGAAVIYRQRGDDDAHEPVLRLLAVSDRNDRRSSGTGRLPICHGGSVLGIAPRERVDRPQELVGRFGAAPCQPRDHLDLPSADRRAVVPGLPLEAAVAGLRRLPVLDRADGRACGVRVSSRARQELIQIIDPLVFLAELAFAVSLLLGLGVRLVAVIAAVYSLHLWLGLYRHPAEWPWNYMFLAIVHVLFAVYAAGRSLGLDAMIRRRVPGNELTRLAALAG